jgi:uncharacterized protein (DUF58 family)
MVVTSRAQSAAAAVVLVIFLVAAYASNEFFIKVFALVVFGGTFVLALLLRWAGNVSFKRVLQVPAEERVVAWGTLLEQRVRVASVGGGPLAFLRPHVAFEVRNDGEISALPGDATGCGRTRRADP